jgi:hypothetical protein
MIFAEHKMLSEKVPLLELQIQNLEQIDNEWRKSDSIKTVQISYCKQQINESNLSIEHLNPALKRQRNIFCYSTVGIVLALCLLLK